MNNWIITLIRAILSSSSGPLRKTLNDFAISFKESAKKTANPWDDILADILCWILQSD